MCQAAVSGHAKHKKLKPFNIKGLGVAETEGFEPSIPLWGMLI